MSAKPRIDAVVCPACRFPVVVAVSMAGERGRCPYCRAVFQMVFPCRACGETPNGPEGECACSRGVPRLDCRLCGRPLAGPGTGRPGCPGCDLATQPQIIRQNTVETHQVAG